MSRLDNSEDLGFLKAVVQPLPREHLQHVDSKNASLGDFVSRYFEPPLALDIEDHSSIREDMILWELSEVLRKSGADVRLLDACCGLAPLAKRILKADIAPDDLRRIHYLAVDRDSGCIDAITGCKEDFCAFREFEPIQRKIPDLSNIGGPVALIALTNTLHELPPTLYPSIFSSLNSLLEDQGKICIVDMEELPQAEWAAITWRGCEVVRFLKAAGFDAAATTHHKSKMVYSVRLNKASEPLDKKAMCRVIGQLLRTKLTEAVKARKRLLNSTPLERLILTGTIARISEELLDEVFQADKCS